MPQPPPPTVGASAAATQYGEKEEGEKEEGRKEEGQTEEVVAGALFRESRTLKLRHRQRPVNLVSHDIWENGFIEKQFKSVSR